MGAWIALGVVVLATAGIGFLVWHRRRFAGRATAAWTALDRDPPRRFGPLAYRPELSNGLPEPARGYLARALEPEIELASRVELLLEGERWRGRGFQPWIARQLLAWPRGFVFQADYTRPRRRLESYLDDRGEARALSHWLWPAGRERGPDTSRSLRHPLALELFWLPDALVPQLGARWERLDEKRAVVKLLIDSEPVDVVFQIGASGRLEQTEVHRWSGPGPDGRWGLRPWVARVLAEGLFDGRTIPAGVEFGYQTDGQLEVIERVTVTQATYR